jgi:hypothetical protein
MMPYPKDVVILNAHSNESPVLPGSHSSDEIYFFAREPQLDGFFFGWPYSCHGYGDVASAENIPCCIDGNLSRLPRQNVETGKWSICWGCSKVFQNERRVSGWQAPLRLRRLAVATMDINEPPVALEDADVRPQLAMFLIVHNAQRASGSKGVPPGEDGGSQQQVESRSLEWVFAFGAVVCGTGLWLGMFVVPAHRPSLHLLTAALFISGWFMMALSEDIALWLALLPRLSLLPHSLGISV